MPLHPSTVRSFVRFCSVCNRIPRDNGVDMQRTGTPPRILLVEDYADSRQMLALLLEGMNYCVLPAANGEEALTAAANNDIDLVLTDFDLPDMTGPTVVRYVRALGNRLAHIPVIMLTAVDEYEHRSLAAEAGCDAFFIKPPNFEVLHATIEHLLQLNRCKNDMGSVTVDSGGASADLN